MQEFSITIAPRFYETDALGHINNAAIAAWLEIVRMKFIESRCDPGAYRAQNWILVSLQIDFMAETFFGSDVSARVTGVEVGNTSLTLLCELSQGDKVGVRGKAVLVYVDRHSRKPQRVPEPLRGRLQ